MLRDGDVLVHHPYDSFRTTVEEFIRQASADPHVLAIKMTLYRTSGDSPIVAVAHPGGRAGQAGGGARRAKARFDEGANIEWAKALEEAGVHVVYGLVGLKVHTKTALVVREEPDGLRRYCHIGTGNYNSKTARIYEDLGPAHLRPRHRRRPHPAVQLPDRLRPQHRLPDAAGGAAHACAPGIDGADPQRDRRRPGRRARGRITMKMNSLVDAEHDRRAVRGVAGRGARSTSSSGASAA